MEKLLRQSEASPASRPNPSHVESEDGPEEEEDDDDDNEEEEEDLY